MRQLKITKRITNRESASLDKYLAEISQGKTITIEEEVELVRLIKKGDEKALEELKNVNHRFIVSIAKQYQKQGIDLTVLIDAGKKGILKATESFNETRNFIFISYAIDWIRKSILKSLEEQNVKKQL